MEGEAPGLCNHAPVEGRADKERDPYTLALTQQALTGNLIRTSEDLATFLAWQANRQTDSEEQTKFQEDALLYPKLLVFTAMQKKSQFIHLIHSAGTYPKMPRADPEWHGKSLGFLQDRMQFASLQLVDLGKNTAWA